VAAPLLSVDEIMAILPASVPRLTALTDGLTEAQLRTLPEPGEWSANDLLAHLRASQDVLGRNITRIVTEERPAWRRLSPREWQRKSSYNGSDFAPAFEAFATGREELLSVLEAMRPADWERVAVVTVGPGRTVEQPARFFGDWLAGHEREHLQQMEGAIRAVLDAEARSGPRGVTRTENGA
jgi:hypothetical protein